MSDTWKKQQGYNFYVYLGPGRIEYFETYDAAKQCADDNGGLEVQEVF
jgi:hypothetical protein